MINVGRFSGWISRCVAVLLVAVMGCAATLPAVAQQQGTLRMAAKAFTEQRLLATMTQMYLEHLGYKVDVTWGLSTSLTRPAQLNNEIDLIWEYTGTSLLVYNHVTETLSAEDTYKRVSELDGKKGLTWLDPTSFNNTYAIAMPEDVAKRSGDMHTMSQFAEWIKQHPEEFHLFAMDYDFAGRADGLPGMSERYGLHLSRSELRSMDPGLVYLALRNKQAFGGVVYTTDGRIDAFHLRILDDDRHFFPAYNAAPVVRTDYLQAHPQLREQLKHLSSLLDEATMRGLNSRVDIGQESTNTVSRDFLSSHGLI